MCAGEEGERAGEVLWEVTRALAELGEREGVRQSASTELLNLLLRLLPSVLLPFQLLLQLAGVGRTGLICTSWHPNQQKCTDERHNHRFHPHPLTLTCHQGYEFALAAILENGWKEVLRRLSLSAIDEHSSRTRDNPLSTYRNGRAFPKSGHSFLH